MQVVHKGERKVGEVILFWDWRLSLDEATMLQWVLLKKIKKRFRPSEVNDSDFSEKCQQLRITFFFSFFLLPWLLLGLCANTMNLPFSVTIFFPLFFFLFFFFLLDGTERNWEKGKQRGRETEGHLKTYFTTCEI